MELKVKYQGRAATVQEVNYINKFIDDNPEHSRRRISQELCKQWNWLYSNGSLKDQVCRGYLLALERAGHITLPAKRRNPPNPLANRKKPEKVCVDESKINNPIKELLPLHVVQVRGTPEEQLYNSLIGQYHYLGYVHPVGEQLKYIVYFGNRAISCISFSSAPRHIGSRDKHIGWDKYARGRNIHLIAYNTRFLILPWVKVKNLASYILGLVSRQISKDWLAIYQHPVYYLETFVDTERFKGTCYKAANWKYLGLTTGRGKNDKTNKSNRSLKAVWGYPLDKGFREKLNS